MKRSEILIVLGLIVFGAIYQFVDRDQSPSGVTAINWIHKLKSGPMETCGRDPILIKGFRKILLSNRAGDISLRNSNADEMEVLPTIECYGASPREAREMAESVDIRHSVNNKGVLEFKVIIPRRFNYKRLRVRLDIRIPVSPEIEIHCGFGIVETEQLNNPAKIFLNHGDLEISGHQSSLAVHHTHGRIQLNGVKDGIKIQSAFSQVSASRCGGGIIQGNQARIELDQIRGDLYVSNHHNRIDLRNITGNINVESSDCPIFLHNLSADTIAIKTSYKPMQATGLSVSSIDIMASHGKLKLNFTKISDTLSIKGRHSRIHLSLPSGIHPMINAQLKYGRFLNKSTLKIDVEKTPVYQRAVSFTGTPVVVVDGRYSDFELTQNPDSADTSSN